MRSAGDVKIKGKEHSGARIVTTETEQSEVYITFENFSKPSFSHSSLRNKKCEAYPKTMYTCN